MRCCLNIGNTHTQIRFLEDDGSRCLKTIPTAGFDPASLPPCEFIAAACVVGELMPSLAKHGVRIVSAETASHLLDFSQVDPSTLGADRIANAVFLAASAPLPAVSLDFGTCVTAEVVDAGKRFLGGVIFPGRALQRQALHDFTSKLPLVPLASEFPPCPAGNTADAIRAGTDAALADAVHGFLDRLTGQLGAAPSVFACGGDREFFLRLPMFHHFSDGGCDLTLRGVELVFQEFSTP